MRSIVVYAYKSSNQRYYTCTLEISQGKLASSPLNEISEESEDVSDIPLLSREEFMEDSLLGMDDIVARVASGKMHERAIAIAMELLL